MFGAWRSLVERFVRVEEVVGSNLAAPTDMTNDRFLCEERPFCYHLLPFETCYTRAGAPGLEAPLGTGV